MSKKMRISNLTLIVMLLACGASTAAEKVVLTKGDLSAWVAGTDWSVAGDAFLNPKNDSLMATREGNDVIVNGRRGKSQSLVSKDEFGDARIHVEFMIPKGSNSGVYLQGRYEIQIFDSWTEQNSLYPGIECGGIYQRWDESRPGPAKGYEGHSPSVNATRPPGQWQTFDIIFFAPRFDVEGKKVANARVVKLWHNGTLIHDNVELTGVTRGTPYPKESAKGPLLLQGDHGPVAFRNIRVVPIEPEKDGLTNPFFAMDTGTIDDEHKTAQSQAEMLRELGYAGIGYWERDPNKDSAGLREMLAELDKRGLKVYGEYFTLNIDEPNETIKSIMDCIPLLRGRQTSIWLALTSNVHQKSNAAGDNRAVEIITELADAAHKQQVGIDLYPHTNFWLEKIDDAERLAGKVNRRNVGVIFNLYHHLKNNRQENIEETIKKAMPYLSGVTINGTSKAGSIETLDKGEFDIYSFLKMLKQDGYKGPVGLQGYGITGDVQDNLGRSIMSWKKFSERLAIEEAQDN